MDAIELLNHDHRMIEQLFRDYGTATSGAQRRAVAETLVRELSKHAALEELMVYPLVKKALPDGAAKIQEHLAQHQAIKETLLALDKKLSAADERTDELMEHLRRQIGEHVREEEDVLLPKVRAAVDQEELDELGQLLARAKQAAPTRPHPNAPDQPPALNLIGPVAAAYDRLRDRLQGRPRT